MVSGPSKGAGEPSYALELHIRGLIHVQIERLPRWLLPTVSTVLSALSHTVTSTHTKCKNRVRN